MHRSISSCTFAILLALDCFIHPTSAQQFLDFINRLTSPSRNSRSAPGQELSDFTSQGLGLVNYITSLRREPIGARTRPSINDHNLLGIAGLPGSPDRVGLPNVNFLQGVPVVPGVVGSLPGAGACLPQGTPLVSHKSPSMLQNFLRRIPGAQDVLRSLQPLPHVEEQRLMGTWYWVLASESESHKFCATSQYKEVVFNGNSASFSILDKFKEGSAHGSPKVGFGYGIKHGRKISVYTQADPCPYEVVAVGPVSSSGQYEYLLLSNWAKYPVIGLARDLRLFDRIYRKHMENTLRDEGYMNFITDIVGSFKYMDWSNCRPASTGNIVGNLLNKIFFGG